MFCRQPIVAAILVGAVLGTSVQAAESGTSPEPWSAYFGLQDREAEWAGFRRGIVRNISGLALIEDTGPGSELYSDRLGKLAEKIRAASVTADLVLPIGAVLSGRDATQFARFIEMIEKDKGSTWKTIVKDQVRAASAVTPQGRSLYWQIDNEINNRHMVASAGVHFGWMNADSYDDRRLIEIYAEYILAPSISGLEEIRVEEGVRPEHARIMLGSIANATRESSERWANELLAYRFDGRFAPSLRGSRVADHVEIISLHYVGTRDEQLDPGPLPRIYDRWQGDGAVKGVWATEELGKARAQKGLGALTALRLVAGYLQWATARSLGSEQVRCSFWGATAGNPKSTAVVGLNTIHAFLGDSVLRDTSTGLRVGGTTAAARTYRFQTADSSREMILVTSVSRDKKNAVQWIALDEGSAVVDIKVYNVSADGLLLVSHEFDELTIELGRRIKIGPGIGVLVLVDRS